MKLFFSFCTTNKTYQNMKIYTWICFSNIYKSTFLYEGSNMHSRSKAHCRLYLAIYHLLYWICEMLLKSKLFKKKELITTQTCLGYAFSIHKLVITIVWHTNLILGVYDRSIRICLGWHTYPYVVKNINISWCWGGAHVVVTVGWDRIGIPVSPRLAVGSRSGERAQLPYSRGRGYYP
jgi:hypothetical protein